ncbi:hypothetical protein UREG_05605 [Uncinocarpus reesii 1704]|uniref:BZIP domain-containing protein n=1 Tax=Uncinocarpus reesii (strain UAMH 1704) TaxID=336963 RepID=C4JT16_UNCRE|nr:uncharacterized protein UREG_05605 [Uncinocarpus reesii 1704]EEP80763.1 hypothetical protein UREG_05605 [Uncinocarpus reesii 1704]
MSGYNGRRAPNFSQYLSDLNTVPSPYDQAVQEDREIFDVDAELALFTNAEFLDFDSKGDMSGRVPVTALGEDQHNPESTSNQDVKYLDMLNVAPVQAAAYSTVSQQPANHGNNVTAAPIQPVFNTSAPPQVQPRIQPTTSAGAKRKQDTSSLDDAARQAQEEDKRRRNTAASARFRVKKKEREKNLERTVKDVTTKNAALEARISQLELENRWLKNLITEKNGSALTDGDISGMFTKFQESKEGATVTQQQQGGQEVKAEATTAETRAS